MIYMTYWFWVFAVPSLILFYIAPVGRAKKAALVLSSIIFHTHFAGPAGVVPIVILGIFTYFSALSGRSVLIKTAMLSNVFALIFYKYTFFFFEHTLRPLFPEFFSSGSSGLWWQSIVPPLAISFFSFEFIHYLYDVLKGSRPLKNWWDFSLFAIFWPSIVAGPVKRYQSFVDELHQAIGRRLLPGDAYLGAVRIASGYFKKIVADNLTMYILAKEQLFLELPFLTRWIILFLIAMRIYLDFSGYTDMALGFAKLMGIKLPENFNWPYVSKNLVEFWRRWHMSLSLWIRDYVYIPLGGSRHGLARKIFSGLLAFFICGLWHGAAWNFAIWGVIHGLGIAICGNYRKISFLKPVGALMDRAPFLAWLVTFLFVCFSWLYFFYPAETAFRMMKALVSL